MFSDAREKDDPVERHARGDRHRAERACRRPGLSGIMPQSDFVWRFPSGTGSDPEPGDRRVNSTAHQKSCAMRNAPAGGTEDAAKIRTETYTSNIENGAGRFRVPASDKCRATSASSFSRSSRESAGGISHLSSHCAAQARRLASRLRPAWVSASSTRCVDKPPHSIEVLPHSFNVRAGGWPHDRMAERQRAAKT